MARSLRTGGRTRSAVIPDLNNPCSRPLVRAWRPAAADGYVALIGEYDGRPDREQQVFEQMRARNVDGYALATAHLKQPGAGRGRPGRVTVVADEPRRRGL